MLPRTDLSLNTVERHSPVHTVSGSLTETGVPFNGSTGY